VFVVGFLIYRFVGILKTRPTGNVPVVEIRMLAPPRIRVQSR